MPNLTTGLVPNQLTTPNVPNTGTGVQLCGANPTRNGLLISNTGANIIWLGPSSVVFVAGTQQQGSFALAANATVCFGGVNAGAQVGGVIIQFPFIWTAAMFAQAAAGATNVVTALEF